MRVSPFTFGALAAAALLSACPWRSYEQILTVHVEVLSSMTTKLLETAETGSRPTPQDVAQLLYPMRRARQFLHQYRTYSDRASYRQLESAVDAYARLVEEVDAARADERRWKETHGGVVTQAKAVLGQLVETQTALERES